MFTPPQTFVYTPPFSPNFKFLEITLPATPLLTCKHVKSSEEGSHKRRLRLPLFEVHEVLDVEDAERVGDAVDDHVIEERREDDHPAVAPVRWGGYPSTEAVGRRRGGRPGRVAYLLPLKLRRPWLHIAIIHRLGADRTMRDNIIGYAR